MRITYDKKQCSDQSPTGCCRRPRRPSAGAAALPHKGELLSVSFGVVWEAHSGRRCGRCRRLRSPRGQKPRMRWAARRRFGRQQLTYLERDLNQRQQPVALQVTEKAQGPSRPFRIDQNAKRRPREPAFSLSAQEWTRTITTLRPLRPERSASTNSATWALLAGRQYTTRQAPSAIVSLIRTTPERDSTPAIKNLPARQYPPVALFSNP